MRQHQVIQEQPPVKVHIPPSGSNGRHNNSENTHSRIMQNGNQTGNNRLVEGRYDVVDGSSRTHHQKSSTTSGNVITSSFYPTKTQIISGSEPTLEKVTQLHTSHIQNNNKFLSKGKK